MIHYVAFLPHYTEYCGDHSISMSFDHAGKVINNPCDASVAEAIEYLHYYVEYAYEQSLNHNAHVILYNEYMVCSDECPF